MNPFRWRKMSWLIIIFTAAMLAWLVSAVGSQPACPPTVANCEAYQAGADIGSGIAASIIFVVWLIGFFVLAVLWFMTRGRHRVCPVCGNDVKKGRSACRKCGYDFVSGLRVSGP